MTSEMGVCIVCMSQIGQRSQRDHWRLCENGFENIFKFDINIYFIHNIGVFVGQAMNLFWFAYLIKLKKKTERTHFYYVLFKAQIIASKTGTKIDGLPHFFLN